MDINQVVPLNQVAAPPSQTDPCASCCIPHRRRLPSTREAVVHKFSVGGHEGYLIVGLFEDGKPGEMFLTMAKEGTTIGGLADSVAKMASLALQYGVSVDVLEAKFAHQRFEPNGPAVGDPNIRFAASIVDYVFRWLGQKYGTKGREEKSATQSALP